jgi:hypothetical protein
LTDESESFVSVERYSVCDMFPESSKVSRIDPKSLKQPSVAAWT